MQIFNGSALVQAFLGSDILVDWRAFTQSSILVYANAVQRLIVRNQTGIYTSNPTNSAGSVVPLTFTTNQSSTNLSDVTVEDCTFDIGGVVTGAAVLIKSSTDGQIPTRIRVSGIDIGNSGSVGSTTADGLDIGACSDVRVSDCHLQSCQVGLGIVSSNVVVENVVARNCGSPGISIGDTPTAAYGINIQYILLANCLVVDCGYSTGTVRGGILISSHNDDTEYVWLSNCVSYESSEAGMDYGLVIYAQGTSGTINILTLTGGHLSGSTGPWTEAHDTGPTLGQILYQGVDNVNSAQGLVVNPSTPYVQFKESGTGSSSASLGSNSPATTTSAPNVWIKVLAPDGVTTVYIPAWK